MSAILAVVDVRHIEALLAVIDEHGFAAAARRLGIGRSTLTERVQALEREVGARLLDRTPPALTAAGRAFDPHARRALRELRNAIEAASDLRLSTSGSLRVGLMANGAAELNVPLFRLLHRMLPGVRVELVDLALFDTEPAVLESRVDVAILRSPVQHPGLVTRQLFLNSRIALMAASHPLAGSASLSVADLDGASLTGVDERQGDAFVDFFLLRAERNGERPRRVLSAASFAEAFDNIVTQEAVATPSADAIRVIYAPGIRGVPLRDAAASGAVAVQRRGDRRPAVLAFMRAAEVVAETCQALVPGSLPLPPV